MQTRIVGAIALSSLCLLAPAGCRQGGTGLGPPVTAAPLSTAAVAPTGVPRCVVVSGYSGDAMEPFVSRDGRYLLFNSLNAPGVNTDIFYASRRDDLHWAFRGRVAGVDTPALEGCPTMDRAGELYFVSPRDYARTLCTVYTGRFAGGAVTGVRPVESVSRKEPGMVNFDVDVSPDGDTLVFVDSRFRPGAGPQTAGLVIARRSGAGFVRSPDSARILGRVNAAGLDYAPTISGDGRALYFTRFDPGSGFRGPQVYRSTRPAADAPFGTPARVGGLGDFVEGTALSPDERLLYFHRKDGGRFNLYAVAVR